MKGEGSFRTLCVWCERACTPRCEAQRCLCCGPPMAHPFPLTNPLPHVTLLCHLLLIARVLRRQGLGQPPLTFHVSGKLHNVVHEWVGTGADGQIQSLSPLASHIGETTAVADLSTRWHSLFSLFLFLSMGKFCPTITVEQHMTWASQFMY